jgi:hypothetical protein
VQSKWYALVANAEFMLHDVQNEAFAEQLRERVRLFGEKERKQDFFLVCEPTWLDKQFPQEAKRVGRPCIALVSTDKIWITCAPDCCSERIPQCAPFFSGQCLTICVVVKHCCIRAVSGTFASMHSMASLIPAIGLHADLYHICQHSLLTLV